MVVSVFQLTLRRFFYFRQGLIDPKIFEIWMIEASEKYLKPPFEGMDVRNVKHKEHFEHKEPIYTKNIIFFNELERTCKNSEILDKQATEIRVLIK